MKRLILLAIVETVLLAAIYFLLNDDSTGGYVVGIILAFISLLLFLGYGDNN